MFSQDDPVHFKNTKQRMKRKTVTNRAIRRSEKPEVGIKMSDNKIISKTSTHLRRIAKNLKKEAQKVKKAAFTKDELLYYLGCLDRKLSRKHTIVIAGGAELLLYYNINRLTSDIDQLGYSGPDKVEWVNAVKKVAEEEGIKLEWISDAVKGYIHTLQPDFTSRLIAIDLPLVNIEVLGLGLPDLIVMKITALREVDQQDLEKLLPKMKKQDLRIVKSTMRYLNEVRPHWALKIQYFLQEEGLL